MTTVRMDYQEDNHLFEEYEIDQRDHRKENSTKWLKSSNASLASLQHVKPVSVYNFGLSSKKDLKATNLTSQRSNSYTNLVTEPVIQSVGSQKTAWGSNASIPDLLNKDGTKLSQRPGSAKTSARKHHPPTGRKPRPQSAKEESVKHTTPGIAVNGAKYDPSGRPPKSYVATTGWIGPPAGMKFADSRPGSAKLTPPPPAGTPRLHIDVDLQSNTTEEENASPRLRYTHGESSRTPIPPPRTPTPPHIPPAPIHLMLPSMYDDEEDQDELDTARLLQMAEQHIQTDKKSESVNDFIEKVSSANHNVNDLPGYTFTHMNGHASYESKLEIHSNTGSDVVSWEKEQVNDSIDFSDFGSSRLLPDSTRNINDDDDSHPLPLEKISVKFSEDKNVTINITPRNAGHKVSELSKKRMDKLEEEGVLQSVLTVASANTNQMPTNTRNKTVSLTEMKHENKAVRTVPNNKSYTKSEKPASENLEFKFSSQENQRCERSLGNRPKSASSNRPTTPLTSVTVAYCDLDDRKHQKKGRRPKSEKDIVTLVQQVAMSDSDEENQDIITPHKLESWMPTKTTSLPSKNYYEISRQTAVVNNKTLRKEKLESEVTRGAPLIKTIKTIELAESGHDLKETKTQSFIDNQTSAFGEKDKQQREATRVRTKTRPVSEMSSRNKLKNDQNKSSNQKDESLQKKINRPYSAPARRQPSSAAKDKNKMNEERLVQIQNDQKFGDNASQKGNMDATYVIEDENDDIYDMETADRDIVLEAEDRDTVLETEDRDTVLEPEDRDEVSDQSFDQDSASDYEIEIPPDKTDKDIEIEKIIEKHLGKPSQTLTILPQNNMPSKSEYKESKLSKEKIRKEKKSTTHSHSQCNCPSKSKSEQKKAGTALIQVPKDNKEEKISNKVYGAFARGSSAPSLRHVNKPKPKERPKTGKPVYITSKIPYDDFETEENVECQQLQAKLAANGVNIKAETLERALYPPSGRTKYYEINAQLPQNTSTNLLSHPREWLPIEYRQLKLAEKALNRANEMMYKQRMAEDRKARLTELAKKKVKGKKKGKERVKKKETETKS